MPRKRKTQSGADAQPVPDSVPGVRYGEGVEHQQLAEALPPADLRSGAPGGAAPALDVGPVPQGGGQVPNAPLDGASLARLMQGAPIGALRGTQDPNEPITAGLPFGPGPGPTRRPTTTPLGRTMHQLAQATGNPVFAELARKAGIR